MLYALIKMPRLRHFLFRRHDGFNNQLSDIIGQCQRIIVRKKSANAVFYFHRRLAQHACSAPRSVPIRIQQIVGRVATGIAFFTGVSGQRVPGCDGGDDNGADENFCEFPHVFDYIKSPAGKSSGIKICRIACPRSRSPRP